MQKNSLKIANQKKKGCIKMSLFSKLFGTKSERQVKKLMPLVEATSGNTGIAFSAIGALFGHEVHIFHRFNQIRLICNEILAIELHERTLTCQPIVPPVVCFHIVNLVGRNV